jgi:hypothetical protein
MARGLGAIFDTQLVPQAGGQLAHADKATSAGATAEHRVCSPICAAGQTKGIEWIGTLINKCPPFRNGSQPID